jgi:Flp pilus assembly secretin CpaC
MRAESLMTAFAFRRSRWPGPFLALVCAVLAPPAAFAADPVPVSATGETLVVHLDQAKTLKLPERTATLVVGNPLIADAVVQPSGIVVITAKSYGGTNLIAVDRSGATLFNRQILVVGPADRVVVVYRGIDRETYSCMPNCERRITIGDTQAYFTANLGQLGTFTTQAQGASAPPK